MTPALAAPRTAAAVMAAGCAVLVARPLLITNGPPVLILGAVFLALLLVGTAWPGGETTLSRDAGWTLLIGLGAFVVARLIGGGHAPHAPIARLLLLNSFAAVAEEAFFRRFVYRLLEPANVAVAVLGSATLFAIVHVTVYGLWVLPIDLAAGLVLSWQRWASGSWRVPAVTHVLANVLVVI
jgi:hypothetical protein